MRSPACIVLFVALACAACTSGDSSAASTPETGTPEAFCPPLVDLAVESALAGAAVGDAGPEAVDGPEFVRTRELLGELIEAAPARVRELVDEASFDPGEGEVLDEDAGRAMWMALADLPDECTGDQTAECTDRLRAVRQEANPTAATDAEISSLSEVCSAAPYLSSTDACDTFALALLDDDGDSELAILEHYAERCR